MSLKQYISILLLVCFFKPAVCQVAVSYYPFQSLLGISSDTEKRFWADGRMETNTFFTNLNMEFALMWNIKKKEVCNVYTGPGLSMNPVLAAANLPLISGYFLAVGTRIKPFEKNRNIQILFELSPYLNQALSGGNFRTRLGLAYNFRKTKNN